MSGGAWKGNGESLLVFEGGCNLVSGQKKTRGSWCDCPGARFDVQMRGLCEGGKRWERFGGINNPNTQARITHWNGYSAWAGRLSRAWAWSHGDCDTQSGRDSLYSGPADGCHVGNETQQEHIFSPFQEKSAIQIFFKKYKISHILNYGN